MKSPDVNGKHPVTGLPMAMHIIVRLDDLKKHDTLVERIGVTGQDPIFKFKKTGSWILDPVTETLAQVHKFSSKTQRLIRYLRPLGIEVGVSFG